MWFVVMLVSLMEGLTFKAKRQKESWGREDKEEHEIKCVLILAEDRGGEPTETLLCFSDTDIQSSARLCRY